MASAGLTEFHLWSKGGWPRVDVAGEFYHQDEIRSLLPRNLSEGAVEIESFVHLVPEPHNRFDSNAVRVEVQGQLVGYLPQEIAGRYVGRFGSLLSAGLVPTTPCHIWAYERDEWKGQDRRGRDIFDSVLSAHVSVVLDSPHLVHPLNVEPTKPHRLLPHGSALQVRGEEKHLEALTPWVAQHGEGWVHGELRAVDVKSTKTTKEVVEILIDGEVIGELTPAMSAHFVPAIHHCLSRGEAVVAKVLLKGNALKVEAVLHAAKAHELDAGWMAALPLKTAGPVPAPRPATAYADRAPAPKATTVGADFELPPKPMSIVFNPAPGWPPPPPGWEPPPGWKPLPDWPAPPEDWQFWTME